MSTVTLGNLLAAIGAAGLLLLLQAFLVAGAQALLRLRVDALGLHWRDALEDNPRLRRVVEEAEVHTRAARVLSLLAVAAFAAVIFPHAGEMGLVVDDFLGIDSMGGGAVAVIVAAVLLLALLFVGELLPRGIGLGDPLRVLQVTAPVLRAAEVLTRPLRRLLEPAGERLLRVAGFGEAGTVDSLDLANRLGESMDGQEGGRKPETSDEGMTGRLVRNALAMRERVIADILLPRNRVVWLDLADGAEANLVLARKAGHTRYPVAEGDLDHVVGVLHIKDVFRAAKPGDTPDLRALCRDLVRVTEDLSLEEALTRMLRSRAHLALVTDDFGGTIGIVTLEQILEELVGEIRDEFDQGEEVMVRESGPGTWDVAGLLPLHDLGEVVHLELEHDEVSTVGGLIAAELDRLPTAGESVVWEGLEFTVLEASGPRVNRVRVRRPEATGAEDR